MADIVCLECKTTVSDETGYCPECGYPFEGVLPELQEIAAADEVQETVTECLHAVNPESLQQTLDSIRAEINVLQSTVTDIKQNFDTNLTSSAENSQKILVEMTSKLDNIVQYNSKREAEVFAEAEKKDKKTGLLAAFYKTLNSPNSMFEYMFYITIVQIVFVVVNLFLVAYIVTLVR